jgi:hypothetical protein
MKCSDLEDLLVYLLPNRSVGRIIHRKTNRSVGRIKNEITFYPRIRRRPYHF